MLPSEQEEDDRAAWGIHTYAWTSSCHAYTLSRTDHSGGPQERVFRQASSEHLRWLGGYGFLGWSCRPFQSC